MDLSSIDFSRLVWTKAVNHRDKTKWAYEGMESESTWGLHWPSKIRTNAQKGNAGDLILLRQRGKVTHLVELQDVEIHHDAQDPQYAIFRWIAPRWVARDFKNAPDHKLVFGWENPPRGGSLLALSNLKVIKNSAGGVPVFQERVRHFLENY